MFQKASEAHHLFDAATCEEFADALYEIGRDLASRKEYDMATKWLERALDVLSEQDLEHLSDDANELKMITMHLLIKSLLAMETAESKKKAHELVGLMDTYYGDKMVVSLLKLEILSSEQCPDAEAYFNILFRMIRSIVLTQDNFKTLLHYLHKLRQLNSKLACRALDELLSLRLLESRQEEWIQLATIMRIWINTSHTEKVGPITEIKDRLDQIFRSMKKPFDASAAHAAQTLLWKFIETSFEADQHEVARSGCSLALHPLFENGGDANRSKICRKALLCALAEQKFAEAREAFFSMPESGQSAPESQYLMYKLALRSTDTDLATSSLEKLCKISDKDATLLYACVQDAIQTGDKSQAVIALRTLLKKFENQQPAGVHFPALLRCSIVLVKSEIKNQKDIPDVHMSELCKMFEAGELSHLVVSLCSID